jgi:hypothetical protein
VQHLNGFFPANRPLLGESARELLARETLGGDSLAAVLHRATPERSRTFAAA